jgi:hexosaminidase
MKYQIAVMLFSACLAFACRPSEAPQANEYHIVPKPVQLDAREGRFTFRNDTRIFLADSSPELEKVGLYLAELLRPSTGLPLELTAEGGADNAVVLTLDEAVANPEGYVLSVTPEYIQIKAAQPAGAFYGVQTLRQLLPPEVNRTEKAEGVTWSAPCVEIADHPRFAYRGMHLDVARHFFPVEFVKRYIDLLAMNKMNRFHWHLTEDQGWRIEIKKYPKLQEIAAFRKETVIGHNNDQPRRFDGQRYGGYYTHEEVREVVAYARDRFVTVIPEIEMPGHSQAALAAYPELACTEGPFEVATHWGIFEDVYCPTETTFKFLEDVLMEVMELFPSEYIHIGGDECPKKRWEESAYVQDLMKREGLKDEHEVQSYFIQRMEKFLNSHGRNIIGWDEILEGGLAPNATVMSWRGTEGGIAAAKQRHDVIMTPTNYCYFDYYQSKAPDEPLAIGGFLPLDSVYSFEPVPAVLTAEEAKHILGAQANLWTEYIKTPEYAEYMAYPRGIALAEVAWSPKESRDFEDFKGRLVKYLKHWDVLRVNYAKHVLE